MWQQLRGEVLGFTIFVMKRSLGFGYMTSFFGWEGLSHTLRFVLLPGLFFALHSFRYKRLARPSKPLCWYKKNGGGKMTSNLSADF